MQCENAPALWSSNSSPHARNFDSTRRAGLQSLCDNLSLVHVAPAFRRACACVHIVGLKADATIAFCAQVITLTLQPGQIEVSLQSASQAAEKVSRFVGRAFRHDIKSAFPSGVLTPEGPKGHFSPTCSAVEAEFGCACPAPHFVFPAPLYSLI